MQNTLLRLGLIGLPFIVVSSLWLMPQPLLSEPMSTPPEEWFPTYPMAAPTSLEEMTTPSDDPAPATAGLKKLLSDPQNRISPEFKVPANLRRRVGFWFDIYTVYTKDQHVIHHVEYPWLVFKVVDVSTTLDGPENRWIKYHRALKMVRKEVAVIRQVLWKLSRKKLNAPMTDEEARIAGVLRELPGNPKAVYYRAASHVRAQLGQRDFMRDAVQRISPYALMMEKIFAEKGLPPELTRIPLVESSFNFEAVSKVGAGGVWQIMPGIGRRFLIVNDHIDERLSPIKSTTVAARLLRENKKILKEWSLAVTAYNHGPGGLVRAVSKLKTTDLGEIILHYRRGSFGFASSNFYSEFLAALHAEKYQDKLFDVVPETPILKDPHIIQKPIRLYKLARLSGIGLDELFHLNRDLVLNRKRDKVLPRGYRIFLPAGYAVPGTGMAAILRQEKPSI